jgi:hypothetical protein
MEEQNFEKKLEEMTKPEIHQLKHEDMLLKAIINAKDKSVVSWWWLSVPLFIIAMMLMKSFYMPGTTLINNIHELESRQKYLSLIFFLISPVILVIVNIFSIRNIYLLSGSPKSMNFLEIVWFNILIIASSVLIIFIYLL